MKRFRDMVIGAGSPRIAGGLTEELLDTTNDFTIKQSGVSRRDFLRIGSTFGFTSTFAAMGALGGVFSAEALAQTAKSAYEKRYKTEPKHKLRLGAIFSPEQHLIQRAGVWDFVRDLEERTDGAIRVEMLMSGSVCAEPTCIQQALQGVLDIGVASTQNASGVAPWLNALDWPYMFQSNGQIYHFMFHPQSGPLFRDVYRKRHQMEFLFTLGEMRKLFMGAKWQDKPPVKSVADLAGTKNRVTNTQLGRIAMQLMNLNPVPVAWVETLDAMKSGLIDGMETWSTACSAFNMAPVVSKYVGLNFIPGTEHTAMRQQTFDKLEPELQEAVLESAYHTQCTVMYNNEAGLVEITGEMETPPPDTIFGKEKVQMNFLTPEALAEAEEIASPKKPEYNAWHERLNQMAGFNVYEKMLPVVREYPAGKRAIDVETRRWWKSA